MLKDVRYIVGVAAGKGGVGKSSMAVNLALTWKKLGYEVGIFDADIYGPSLGLMMPLETAVEIQDEFINPGIFQGVQAMSLAYLKTNKEALMARAPVANGLIAQCIEKVNWKELDYLIVDFPPGTGDIQLTLMQMLPFSGVVLVTTPQEVSLLDVQKAAQMFIHMGVSLLGVIENMSYFQDPSTLVRHFVFGEGGGRKISGQFGIPFLGQVPIDASLSRCADQGVPFPLTCAESCTAQIFHEMSMNLSEILFSLEEAKKVCLKDFEYAWKEME